jgi:hypothetical protein
MKKTILLLILLFILSTPAFAADSKVITLQDGSKIKGNVIGMDNGSYVVETPSMGQVHIPDNNVASITAASSAEIQEQAPSAQDSVPSNITATPEFKSMQAQMMSNPEVMGDIQKLIQDPDVMAVMADPSFIAAIQSGNTASLQSDPRLKRLSDNPNVQALIQKIKSQ